jgi:hypothetical protein
MLTDKIRQEIAQHKPFGDGRVTVTSGRPAASTAVCSLEELEQLLDIVDAAQQWYENHPKCGLWAAMQRYNGVSKP